MATDWKHRVEERTLVSDERTILFITYKCDADAQSIEVEAIDKMVNSIKMHRL